MDLSTVYLWILIREGVKKNVFFGDLSQMWAGGVADSQTRSKPLITPKSPRKWPFSTQISPFVFPNLTKTLGWVGGKTDLGKISQLP